VRVPVWLTLGFAIILMVWGAYRIRLGLKKPAPDVEGQRVMGGGLARMNPRTHLLLGAVYILFGVALIATSFGWNPLGRSMGPDTQAPSKDKAPTKSGIPVDQLPAKKS
jgi:hypothetical protein